jgi:hypothetical protein
MNVSCSLREIEFLLSVPSPLTTAQLRLHPDFDRLRNNPRFRQLAGIHGGTN